LSDSSFFDGFTCMNERSRAALQCVRNMIAFGAIAAFVAIATLCNRPNHAELTRTIHQAAQRGNRSLLESAIESGASVNAVDEQGITPLIQAARAGRTAIVEELIEKGADVNFISPTFGTALMQAALYERDETAAALLAHGADPAAKYDWGRTAADFARTANDFALAKRLDDLARR
jgi:ankyrin repeat protein